MMAGAASAAPITAGFDFFSTPSPSAGGDSFIFIDADGNPGNGAETKVFLEDNPIVLPLPPGTDPDDDFFPGVDPVFLRLTRLTKMV